MDTKKNEVGIDPIEIEKKFLVNGNQWELQVSSSFLIYQGYYKEDNEYKRLRLIPEQNKAIKGMKKDIGSIDGFIERKEIEEEIPYLQGLEILEQCRAIIIKKRHLIPFEEFIIEVDVFKNLPQPLTLAEIEVKKEQIPLFKNKTLPAWIGEDISDSAQHRNATLSHLASKVNIEDIPKETSSNKKLKL